MIKSLLMGLVVGFFVAAPLGPINLLCIHRSLLFGTRSGFITGMGAAFADAIYGAIAAFGLAALQSLLLDYTFFFHLMGGGILCVLGFLALLTKQGKEPEKLERRGLISAFFTTFLLALFSPSTILSFAAAFTVLGVGVEITKATFEKASYLTLGVFLGSSLWWFLLSFGINLFKHVFNLSYLDRLNRFSGVLMILFGLFIFVLAWFPHWCPTFPIHYPG